MRNPKKTKKGLDIKPIIGKVYRMKLKYGSNHLLTIFMSDPGKITQAKSDYSFSTTLIFSKRCKMLLIGNIHSNSISMIIVQKKQLFAGEIEGLFTQGKYKGHEIR